MSAPAATTAPDPALLAEVAAFLYREADLLDTRALEEWLELYTEDALYWLPQGEENDPVRHVSIAHDDRRRLAERVLRLRSGFAFSQEPPSRTLHLVGNVRIVGDVGDVLEVDSSLIVAEMRRGHQRLYAGHVHHRLARAVDGFHILRKEIRLVNSDLPLGNLTFLI